MLTAGNKHSASANGSTSHAPGEGDGALAGAHLSTLIAVASLVVPVSTLAGVMELEFAGVPMVLSASGAWIALALVAVLGAPMASTSARACAGSADAVEPDRA